jgi:hypothetical protein
MDAPDRCALPPEISCTAGAVHTWLNGQIIAHYAGAGAVHSIRSAGAAAISFGFGYSSLPWLGAALSLFGAAVSLWSLALETRARTPIAG